MFYLHYLSDVVPFEISVDSVPINAQFFDLAESSNEDRVEIQLQWAGRIFMTGLVGMESRPTYVERTAATLAYENWRKGWCVRERHQAWGMFTATPKIRFCISLDPDGRDWERVATFHPIQEVRGVVAYLRQEFERIRPQYQV